MKLHKRLLKSPSVIRFGAVLITFYIKFVGLTTRWKVINGHVIEKDYRYKPFIIAFWHGRLLMIPYLTPKGAKGHVLSSKHRDAAMIAAVQKKFGFDMIWGSSRGKTGKDKGGSGAIRQMVRAKRKGEAIAITPDGPRGPARKVGGQIIEIAKLLELPIIPVTFSTSRCRIIGSWDSFMLAKPFGKGVFIVGDPIPPNRAEELEERMNKLTDEADIAVKTL